MVGAPAGAPRACRSSFWPRRVSITPARFARRVVGSVPRGMKALMSRSPRAQIFAEARAYACLVRRALCALGAVAVTGDAGSPEFPQPPATRAATARRQDDLADGLCITCVRLSRCVQAAAQRKADDHAGPGAGRALQDECAAKRLDAVAKAAQPRAGPDSCATDTVVASL